MSTTRSGTNSAPEGDFLTAPVHGLSPCRILEVAGLIVPDRFSLEALLLVGSLAEGFASATSDIDLIVLVSGPGELAADEIALEVDGVIVDVQMQSLQGAVDKLGECIRSEGEAKCSERALVASPFSEGDRIFLHRLLTGRYLSGSPDRLAPAAEREAALRSLRRLKFNAARHFARARQVDAHGCFVDGEFALAGAMAHDALHHSVDALMAALGESNITAKWRLRHLRRREVEGRISPEVGTVIAKLLMSGVDPTDDAACATFAARGAAAARVLLAAATIAWEPDLASHLRVKSDGLAGGMPAQRLRLDLDCRISHSAAQLRLLSGGRPPIDIGIGALETLFLADADAPFTLQVERGTLRTECDHLDLSAWLAGS